MSDVHEWRRFEVGERVRVRLSLECRSKFAAVEMASGRKTRDTLIGHEPDEDGVIGSVIEVDTAPIGRYGVATEGHFYEVDFDVPIWTDAGGWGGGRYAAAELEPLDAES